MANFKRIHTIYSKTAKDNNINNYPGVDINKDPCLTENFIWTNLQNLYQNCLNPIINHFGSDFIRITSAYKSSELERFLGGNPSSQHVYGFVADIISVKHPTSMIWNWGIFTNLDQDFSWIHISYIDDNNPKTTSLSSKIKTLHKKYEGELTTNIGSYTHGITLADENLL